MSTVTGLTAEKMQEISDASIVSASINGSGHLILTNSGGETFDVGAIVGPTGSTGPTGPTGPSGAAPPGSVVMYGATIPPTGWLICNGAAVSRATYAALFAIIGTTFGAGNGTTTFNLPSMEARFPTQNTGFLGASGGAATHPHQIDGGSIPAYAEVTILTGPGPHIYFNRVTSPAWTSNFDATGASDEAATTSKNSATPVIGITQTASNIPPYLNMTFIIKF
jgi:microcystin-dependent protein